MAKRKSRRKRRGKSDADKLSLIVLAGLLMLWAVVQFAQRHPVIAGLTAFGVVCAGAGLAYLRVIRIRRLAEHERAVAITDGMSGAEFEQFTARLMRAGGFRRVTVSGGAGDKGADITGYTPDGRRVVVQCKRYKNKVGSPEVQRFAGTAHRMHGADIALLVTNGGLTAQAWEVAAACDITVVDRASLSAWLATNVPPLPGWRDVRPSPGASITGATPKQRGKSTRGSASKPTQRRSR